MTEEGEQSAASDGTGLGGGMPGQVPARGCPGYATARPWRASRLLRGAAPGRRVARTTWQHTRRPIAGPGRVPLRAFPHSSRQAGCAARRQSRVTPALAAGNARCCDVAIPGDPAEQGSSQPANAESVQPRQRLLPGHVTLRTLAPVCEDALCCPGRCGADRLATLGDNALTLPVSVALIAGAE